MVVIHYTAMESAGAAEARLCDPAFEVSAHYLIGRDGATVQMVDERLRAWHAGAGQWGDVTDVNSRSIGVELDNDGTAPFPTPQMSALICLLRGIFARWRIRPERVIGHSDMATGRKIDPGPHFDWQGLAQVGLAVRPDVARRAEEGRVDPVAFRRDATAFGYAPGLDAETLLAPFRLRFRRGLAGPLDAVDCAMAANLAHRFAVDQGRRQS